MLFLLFLACGILAPRLGIEPGLSAVSAENGAEAIARVRALVDMLPANCEEGVTVEELTDSDGLYEFWELLEECRIAIFAPEVKCAVRSPLAKLEKAWEDLRI